LDGAINDFLAEQARCKLVALWRGRSRACPPCRKGRWVFAHARPTACPSFAARVARLGLEDVEVHVVAHVATRGWFVGLEVPWRARPLAQSLIEDMAAALARPHGLVKGGEVPARSKAALEVSPDVGMVGEEREVLEFVRISAEIAELRRIGRCRSARGPDADRRHKLLIPIGTNGSKLAPNNTRGARDGPLGRQQLPERPRRRDVGHGSWRACRPFAGRGADRRGKRSVHFPWLDALTREGQDYSIDVAELRPQGVSA